MRCVGVVALTWFCLASAEANDEPEDELLTTLDRETKPICTSVFDVKLTGKDGNKRSDTLDTCDGKLSLELLEENDFESPRYSSHRQGDELTFRAKASGKAGRITIVGTIRGSVVSGTIVWLKPSGQSERYQLKGKHCPYPCL
jgi:hypothetical protein